MVSWFSYAYFYQASDQSTAARFDLMRSLLERRTLWIDGYCGYNTADIVRLGAHYYSVKAPGTSFTALLAWRLVLLLLAPLAGRNEAVYWALATYFTIVLTVSLLVACMTVVMYRFTQVLGASPARAAALALILAFATILFPYATEMTGEPIAAVCLLTSFYLLVTSANQPGSGRALFAGLLAGWAVLNDFPSMPVALALALYALARLARWRHLFGFVAGAAFVAAILFAYNRAAFGSPWFISYQAYKLAENAQFPEQARGFVGLSYPHLTILWKVLGDPQRGLFFCNPVLLLMVPGLVYFRRRTDLRAEFIVTLAAIAVFILFNGSFGESIVSWGGGTATGPRQMTPAIPFMVLALVFVPAALDGVTAALAMVSALIMLAATSTNPHFPYEYQNPVRDFALAHYFRADLSFNRDTYFGGGMIVGDTVAFNIGKLLGLAGPLQLLPLGAVWIAAAGELLADLALWGAGATAVLGEAAAALAIAALFVPPLTARARQQVALAQAHGLLGRYFMGDQPGEGPPHLVRIDRELNFSNVAQLGAMPYPSCVVWTGYLIAPTSGRYVFVIQADDTGWLRIDNTQVIADPGVGARRNGGGGMIRLNAGRHRILAGQRNVVGEAAMRLYWARPGAGLELVPSAALIPDRADASATR